MLCGCSGWVLGGTASLWVVVLLVGGLAVLLGMLLGAWLLEPASALSLAHSSWKLNGS